MIMKKHSAGLLVYRLKGSAPEVLIAHMGGPFHAKKDAGHWSIPKGEYEDGEDPKKVAEREFNEELGKQVPDGEWLELGKIEYKNGKEVVAWAISGDLDVSRIESNNFELEWPPGSGKIQEFPEIDRAAWFNLPEAAAKLIPAQAEFISRLAELLEVPFGAETIPEPPQQNSLF
jgi:predicted NUDIX family NTP pyrophosphohydrolase